MPGTRPTVDLPLTENGVESKAETYLTNFVKNNTTVDHLDLYHVMRAAGQVETLLQITSHTSYAPVKKQDNGLF